MLSYWLYILLGNDRTGKTTFQKRLIFQLCGVEYQRLGRNRVFEITHPRAPKKLTQLFIMSRSYQENKNEYESLDKYFSDYFQDADICILSSHLNLDDVREMMDQAHRIKYNVGGIFWSNSDNDTSEAIARFNWDERFWMNNPSTEDEEQWNRQIDSLAKEFSELLILRAYSQ